MRKVHSFQPNSRFSWDTILKAPVGRRDPFPDSAGKEALAQVARQLEKAGAFEGTMPGFGDAVPFLRCPTMPFPRDVIEEVASGRLEGLFRTPDLEE